MDGFRIKPDAPQIPKMGPNTEIMESTQLSFPVPRKLNKKKHIKKANMTVNILETIYILYIYSLFSQLLLLLLN